MPTGATADRVCQDDWATLSRQLTSREREQALQVCGDALSHAPTWTCDDWGTDTTP